MFYDEDVERLFRLRLSGYIDPVVDAAILIYESLDLPPDQMIERLTEALRMLRDSEDPQRDLRRARAYLHRAKAWLRKSKFSKALRDASKAVELFEKFNKPEELGEAYLVRSKVYASIAEHSYASEDSEIALKYLKNPSLRAEAYFNRIIGLINVGKREEALRELNKATVEFSLQKDELLQAEIFRLAAEVYAFLGYEDKAGEFARKAWRIAKRRIFDDSRALPISVLSAKILVRLLSTREPKKAQRLLERILQRPLKQDRADEIIATLEPFLLKLAEDDPYKALEYLEALLEKDIDGTPKAEVLYLAGIAYKRLGMLHEALEAFKDAYGTSGKDKRGLRIKYESLLQLSSILRELGRYEDAKRLLLKARKLKKNLRTGNMPCFFGIRISGSTLFSNRNSTAL